ncbi:hypothetical protein C462_16130 [Halorubrum distributum JCM 13916]|uniref:Uncharacterized protein n=1 Tax=Halorubrum distributum JCM 13916 TaxID=1230455 RepID=M0PDJ9_9EURY|nr:hypothetical protein C462_16130 [Halorubrum arcis JCM 13916]
MLGYVSHHFTIFEFDRLFEKHNVVLFECVCDLNRSAPGESPVTVESDTDVPSDGISHGFEEGGDFVDLCVRQRVLVVSERITL